MANVSRRVPRLAEAAQSLGGPIRMHFDARGAVSNLRIVPQGEMPAIEHPQVELHVRVSSESGVGLCSASLSAAHFVTNGRAALTLRLAYGAEAVARMHKPIDSYEERATRVAKEEGDARRNHAMPAYGRCPARPD